VGGWGKPGLVMFIVCRTLNLILNFASLISHFILLIGTERNCSGLVVRVPGYRTEMYCVSCEVQTEFIYVM
jgi:hypothetical protein